MLKTRAYFLTNNILKHLGKNRNYARVLFIDFSSAFNTIQPHVMVQKLKDLNVSYDIIAWVLEFLTQTTVCKTKRQPFRISTNKHRS